ncbi:SIR2 family protein [Methyloglobulus sp.]|uniref:SIR2 family protein n=1 Tax=Methyloglobulus sp. TaxID=2518622 RepID=UPI00398972DB
MTSLSDIKNSFQEGRLIPFVGAGFSMVDSKAPSWKELLAQLALDLNSRQKLIFYSLTDNLEQAEYYNKVRPGKIIDKVKAILDSHPNSPDSLEPHKLLLCNFDRIYTTNYDKYFEDVALSLSIEVQNVPTLPLSPSFHPYITRNPSSNRTPCVHKPSPPCSSHNNARRLVKYHGDYRVPKSLILTETSYFERLLDADAKDMLFAGDALFYDFLFLGYSFQDINLKYTLQQLERTFETLGNTITGKRGRRENKFFILRTADHPRNHFQDIAYKLKSLDMKKNVKDGFEKSGCQLKSFKRINGERLSVEGSASNFLFSSFPAVWACTEVDSYCKCATRDCSKVHLIGLSGKEDEITKAAKEFRAQVLNEGFTNFLKDLGCK